MTPPADDICHGAARGNLEDAYARACPRPTRPAETGAGIPVAGPSQASQAPGNRLWSAEALTYPRYARHPGRQRGQGAPPERVNLSRRYRWRLPLGPGIGRRGEVVAQLVRGRRDRSAERSARVRAGGRGCRRSHRRRAGGVPRRHGGPAPRRPGTAGS